MTDEEMSFLFLSLVGPATDASFPIDGREDPVFHTARTALETGEKKPGDDGLGRAGALGHPIGV